MVTTTLPLIRSWDPGDDALLLHCKDRLGLSFTEAGKRLGRTKSSCISRYQRLKGIRRGRHYEPTGKDNG